jgi:hypothetical protein
LKAIRLKRGLENLDVMDYLLCFKARLKKSIEKKIEKKKRREERRKARQSKRNKGDDIDEVG